MPDPEHLAVEIVDVPTLTQVDTQGVSRRQLRDLSALLALPAIWVDQDSTDIVAGLLDVLFGVLRLDFGYARFGGATGAGGLEFWRPRGSEIPAVLSLILNSSEVLQPKAITIAAATLTDDGNIRLTRVTPPLIGQDGIVIVGSSSREFPTSFDLYLLRVAVGQAAISIHSARRLAGERAARTAAEDALQRRNAFLAQLADDLIAPLSTLGEHVTQAHDLASEVTEPTAPAIDVGGTASESREQALPPLPPVHLTRRESEVLGLLAQGLSNKEIAAVLWLSERTIERHVTGLYRKIGVERRTEATAFALRYGLAGSNEPEA